MTTAMSPAARRTTAGSPGPGVVEVDHAAADKLPASRRCGRPYPDGEALRDLVRFYRGTFVLQDALYGAEPGDAEAFGWGIAPYQ